VLLGVGYAAKLEAILEFMGTGADPMTINNKV
jgi:hypothetical protein